MAQDYEDLHDFDQPTYAPVDYGPTVHEVQQRQAEEAKRRAAIDAADVGDLFSSAVSETWMLAPLFKPEHASNFEHEVIPELSEHEKNKLYAGLPANIVAEMEFHGRSLDHMYAIKQAHLDRQETQQILTQRFGTPTVMASYFGAALLDPVNLAAMAATGPAYTAIASSGKLAWGARFLRTGALAGTEGVAWGVGRAAAGDPLMGLEEIATIGAFGAGLGGAFGALFGKHTPDMHKTARTMQGTKLAREGAEINEAGFRALRQGYDSNGPKMIGASKTIDEQQIIRYRPRQLEANNRRPYGYVSIFGTRERGNIGVSIAQSSVEDLAIMQGGRVFLKTPDMTVSGFVTVDPASGKEVVRLHSRTAKFKPGGQRLGGPDGPRMLSESLSELEATATKRVQDFVADAEAHGIPAFPASPRLLSSADAPRPTAGAEKQLSFDFPEIAPTDHASMLNKLGRELDGNGNGAIPALSSVNTIEARVSRIAPASWSKLGHTPNDALQGVRHIHENVHGGKKFIDELSDAEFMHLATLPPAQVRSADIKTLKAVVEEGSRVVQQKIAKDTSISVVESAASSKFFSSSALRQAQKESSDPASGVHLVYMSPEDFLMFAKQLKKGTPGGGDPIAGGIPGTIRPGLSTEDLQAFIAGGNKLDSILELKVVDVSKWAGKQGYKGTEGAFEVNLHNGRHRAEAFQAMGVTEIPVLLRGQGDELVGELSEIAKTLVPERGFGTSQYRETVEKAFPVRKVPSKLLGDEVWDFSSVLDLMQPSIKRLRVGKKNKHGVAREYIFNVPTEVRRQTVVNAKTYLPAEMRVRVEPLPSKGPLTSRSQGKQYILETHMWGGGYVLPAEVTTKAQLVEHLGQVLTKYVDDVGAANKQAHKSAVGPKQAGLSDVEAPVAALELEHTVVSKIDEIESIVVAVRKQQPELAATPEWTALVKSLKDEFDIVPAGRRSHAAPGHEERMQAHINRIRSRMSHDAPGHEERMQAHINRIRNRPALDPDNITIDITPHQKRLHEVLDKKRAGMPVDEDDLVWVNEVGSVPSGPAVQASMFGRDSLEVGDQLFSIGGNVFAYNQRLGTNTNLEDLVMDLRKAMGDVDAETARAENKFLGTENLDAFKNTVSRSADEVSEAGVDFNGPFAEHGVRGSTLGPAGMPWQSWKTKLSNTASDAFNWLSLHAMGNQAGAQTKLGTIVSAIEDPDSWIRLGLSVDRDNMMVTMAAKSRETYRSSYNQWKKATQQTMGQRWRMESRSQFNKEVTRFLRDPELFGADPATLSAGDKLIQKAAKEYSRTYEDTLTWLAKHDPEGPWKDIKAAGGNKNYAPRRYLDSAEQKLREEFGVGIEEQITALFARAIQKGAKGGKEISNSAAIKMATLYRKKLGGNNRLRAFDHPALAARDPKKFMQILQKELGLSEDEAREFTALFAKKVDDGTHGKYRVRLDENVSIKMTGSDGHTRDVSFHELLDSDIVRLTDSYLHDVISVAGEREMVRLFSKKLGVEGLYKSMDDLKPRIIADLTEKGTPLQEAEEMFNGLLRQIQGTPHSDSVVFARNARNLRDVNYSLGAGSGFGVSALGDFANSLFSHGVGTALEAVGMLKTMTKSGAVIQMGDDEMKILLEALAMGDSKLNAMRMNHAMDDIGDIAGVGGKIGAYARQAAQTTSELSGINAVTKWAENLALKVHSLGYIRKMIDDVPINETRLAQMGYTPESWARDAAMMRKNVRRSINEDGVEVLRPNLAEWADQSAARRFLGAMQSEVTSHVIRADMNDMPAFFRKNGGLEAIGQLLLQFRSFGMTATRSMLIRNVKANDARAYGTFLTALAGGALVYTLKQRLKHGGDSKEFEEAMAWERLLQGSVAMSAVGSSTEIMDAAAALLTGEGMTGHSYSPSKSLLGNPTARSADSAFKALGIVPKGLRGDEITESDLRSLRDLSLIGNHPLVRVGSNLIQTTEN